MAGHHICRRHPLDDAVADIALAKRPDTPDANPRAVREACRRLLTLGCITNIGPGLGVCRVADRSNGLLKLRKFFEMFSDFHTAYFLGSIYKNSARFFKDLKRVIIRITVIHIEDVARLYDLKDGAQAPSIGELMQYCAGVGAKRLPRGAAWTSLAIFQKLQTSKEGIAKRGSLSVDAAHKDYIIEYMTGIEQFMGVDLAVDKLSGTELTDAEVDMVETQHMPAWLHRMVSFPGIGEPPFDLLSIKNMSVAEDDIFDVNAAFEIPGPGMFAI
ncbi:hypothetical protein AAE478_007636 [Parahypoxylon ruwenzoriense]